ncbi:MAG: hypothetical protein ACRD28_10835 [Acidobacteriaceae bacterium]
MQTDIRTLPKRGVAPAWTLLLLAPIVAELLSGATRISTIFALVPEIMTWGCGALIIREMARRRKLGWPSLLLMGLALSIAEEFLIQQTSLAPLPWLHSIHTYGRALGVNWLYFLFMLGYESVWVVLVPVSLTEFIFHKRREDPWLRLRGLIIAALFFILGSFIAWYAWIKRVRPMIFHAPFYRPPWFTLLIGALAIVALVAFALTRRPRQPRVSRTSPPPPWLLGLLAVVLGLPWYGLLTPVFSPNAKLHALPLWVPMVIGIAWFAMIFFLIRHWSSGTGWSDAHRYALTFGAMLVPMIGGFSGSGSWLRIDLVGKSVLDVIAVLLLIALGRAVRDRSSQASAPRAADI